jgi:hypothetical protein
MIGTAKNRPAAAQGLNADLNAALQTGLSPVLNADMTTDLNIGLRIELGMNVVSRRIPALVRSTQHRALRLVFGLRTPARPVS